MTGLDVDRPIANWSSAPRPRAADAVPPLHGKWVHLRPVSAADYPYLVELQSAPENMIRWRYRGTSVSPEQLIQSLWLGVLAQFMIVENETDEPVGLIVCYNPEYRHGYAYLAMIVSPRFEMSGWTLEANALFLAYLFETFTFRKIYLEVIEFNFARLASGAEVLFHVEGCMRDHEFHLGRWWHQYTLAIYREEFELAVARLAPHLEMGVDRLRNETG